MEAGQNPTPAPGDPISVEDVRRATFPQAIRGYDRQAVHDMLDRVADWMEGRGGAAIKSSSPLRDELARVGERTAGILTAAEEAARLLRDEAVEYAERLRADAEDEVRKARLNASQKTDEMVAEAEAKGQRIIDDAIARRRQLNQAISSLIDRRDEIAADATRLAEELLIAVEELRAPDATPAEIGQDEDIASEAEPESAEQDIEEPEPESAEHDLEEAESAEHDIAEPESTEAPTLLVDPDAEDEAPPYRPSR